MQLRVSSLETICGNSSLQTYSAEGREQSCSCARAQTRGWALGCLQCDSASLPVRSACISPLSPHTNTTRKGVSMYAAVEKPHGRPRQPAFRSDARRTLGKARRKAWAFGEHFGEHIGADDSVGFAGEGGTTAEALQLVESNRR